MPQNEHPPAPAPAPAPGPVSGMSAGMNANTWAMGCHLAALLGFVFPFGNFLGPLVIWLAKKDTMPEVDRHGKASLNFQISLTIWMTIASVISVILMLVVIGFFTLILTLVAWLVLGVLFPILAGIRANEGKEYRYPLTIEFIK